MMNRRDAIVGGLAGFAASTIPLPAQAAPKKNGPIFVAFVVGPGATVIDFAGPWEVFQDVEQPEFRLAMVSDSVDVFEATDGMLVKPRFTYDTVPVQPDVIVMGAQGQHSAEKIAWIRKAAEKADVVMSVCTGAFLLAKTGLLDGLSATTHHDFYDRFQQQFPKVHLVRGPRFVDNGKILAAGGLTSGIELALHVVQRYAGSAVTDRTAYYMEYNRSDRRPTG